MAASAAARGRGLEMGIGRVGEADWERQRQWEKEKDSERVQQRVRYLKRNAEEDGRGGRSRGGVMTGSERGH